MSKELTAERLHGLLRYDPERGRFFWLQTGRGRRAGQEAGSVMSGGYRMINIDGCSYREHMLVWLAETGKWPDTIIDHKNHVTSDNRFSNLRLCTPLENQKNMRKHRDNRSGFKGVCQHRRTGRWHARIMVSGREYSLGVHETPEGAARAYDQAAKRLHGDYACLNFA
jgi:hypothetical protein